MGILLAFGHDASGDRFAREATVVAGRAAAALGGDYESCRVGMAHHSNQGSKKNVGHAHPTWLEPHPEVLSREKSLIVEY